MERLLVLVQFGRKFCVLQDVFGGRLTAFVHNAGLYVNMTTSSAEAPANLEPDEDWNDRIYGETHKMPQLSLDALFYHVSSVPVWASLNEGTALCLSHNSCMSSHISSALSGCKR